MKKTNQSKQITEVEIFKNKLIDAQLPFATPWKTMNEFVQVFDQIFGRTTSIQTKQLAFTQIHAWKFSHADQTPEAILGTADILEIQLKDAESGTSPDQDQINNLLFLYSSSLNRFNKSIEAILQDMDAFCHSKYELNSVRDAIHLTLSNVQTETPPSLEVFRKTTGFCLKWLEECYWKPLRKRLENTDIYDTHLIDPELERRIMRLFLFYDIILECALKGKQKLPRKTIRRVVYNELKAYTKWKKTIVIEDILQEIVKDLERLLVENCHVMYLLAEVYKRAILGLKFVFALVETYSTTEKQIEQVFYYTQRLFKVLAQQGLIEDLFYGLLKVVENEYEVESMRAAASFWANQLVFGYIIYCKCLDAYNYELSTQKTKDSKKTTFEKTTKNLLEFFSQEGLNTKAFLTFTNTHWPWPWKFRREFLEERKNSVNKYTINILKNATYLVDPKYTMEEIQLMKETLNNKLTQNVNGTQPVEQELELIKSTGSSTNLTYVKTSKCSKVGNICAFCKSYSEKNLDTWPFKNLLLEQSRISI